MHTPHIPNHQEDPAGIVLREEDDREAMKAEDARLASSSARGDSESFGKLYDKHFDAVYRFLAYRVSDKSLAQDLASQTFLKALEHIRSFDGRKASFLTWVMRIARNTLIDAYRTQRTVEDIDAMDVHGEENSITDDIDMRRQLSQLRTALKQLPQTQRDIIQMRVWDGLSYREIAQIMGKSEASCKMMASRTLRTLRDKIPLTAFILLVASCL